MPQPPVGVVQPEQPVEPPRHDVRVEAGGDEASSALGTGFGAVVGPAALGALGAVFILRRN